MHIRDDIRDDERAAAAMDAAWRRMRRELTLAVNGIERAREQLTRAAARIDASGSPEAYDDAMNVARARDLLRTVLDNIATRHPTLTRKDS